MFNYYVADMTDIKEKEIALFEIWKQYVRAKRKEENLKYLKFCEDGIVNPDIWDKQTIKIVLLLKDINFDESKTLTQWLASESFIKRRIATWGNVGKWIYGLMHIDENPSWEKARYACGNYKGRFKQIQKICVVNLKKQPGKTTCPSQTLTKYFHKYNKEFFVKQMQLYVMPDYIICGGKDVEKLFCNEQILKSCFGDNCKMKDGSFSGVNYWVINNKTVVIGFHHPQPYNGKLFKEYYEKLTAVADYIRKNVL